MKIIFITSLLLTTSVTFAADEGGGFTALLQETVRLLPSGGEGGIDVFLNNTFKLLISIGAALAVGMFVWGGLTYLTSSAGVSTEGAKTKMTNAVLGLLMLLATWVIFNTINPDILSLKVDPVVIPAEGTAQ